MQYHTPQCECRSIVYSTAKAACYVKASQFAKVSTGSSEKKKRFCLNSATISAWAHMVYTLLEKQGCASHLLIKWHTAVYYPQYLCFSEDTSCLTMQIWTHMWTAVMSQIMKFYLSNLIEFTPDSNNTSRKKQNFTASVPFFIKSSALTVIHQGNIWMLQCTDAVTQKIRTLQI